MPVKDPNALARLQAYAMGGQPGVDERTDVGHTGRDDQAQLGHRIGTAAGEVEAVHAQRAHPVGMRTAGDPDGERFTSAVRALFDLDPDQVQVISAVPEGGHG